MNIGGRYATRESLGAWVPTIADGDIPVLWAEFEFLTRSNPPERLPIWSMVDTGADRCIIPPLALGILFPNDGSVPQFGVGTIGARLYFTPTSIRGIGGTAEGLLVPAKIKLGGKKLPGRYDVMVGGNFDYPIIGRDVLNQFVGLLHPFAQRLLLSNTSYMRAFASGATKLG